MQIILFRSQTCPQCRKDCTRSQTQRIYIDFACDEDLACARIPKDCSFSSVNSDAEETIKILLEHIEKGPDKEQQVQECEFCKEFQEAYNDALTEKDLLAQTLGNIERENVNLLENNQRALNVIETLDLEVKANRHNLQEMEERLEKSEKFIATIQSENLFKQDLINNLKTTISKGELELQKMCTQLQNQNDKMNEMTEETIKHAAEFDQVCRGLRYIIHGNCQRRLIKQYRNHSVENVELPTKECGTNECRAIVPYCGDIDSWAYMVIPILKKSSHK